MEKISSALTFDDVLIKPGFTDFERNNIQLTTHITKKVSLACPVVSAPMDTVTEAPLAIALAAAGGMGIIHRNLTIEDQADEIRKVREAGYVASAAVGSSPGFEKRVKALVDAGATIVVVDSAHGNSSKVLAAVRTIKELFDVEVIAGNIATKEGAKSLIAAGADGLRVGMGPGAICSTRVVSGMGVPQLTALFETAQVAREHNVPIIADGGIKYSGDVVKALAAGASTVMLGRLFAGTKEAPGATHELNADQVPARFQSIIDGSASYVFKEYRGMGSIGAMERGRAISSEDEFHGKNFTGDVLVAEGVEGMVPCTGSVKQLLDQMTGGVVSGMYYIGAKTIYELWDKAIFMQITQASLTESHPHDLFITNPGDNYQ